MFRRGRGITFCLGLQLWEDKVHFWSLLAEYPSHHTELPPGAEAEFIRRISSGMYND